MKVSSRLGDLSGCTVWGSPHPAPLSGLLPRLPRPADSAEPAGRRAGPGARGRCAVAGPWRRLGPRPAGLPGRPGGRPRRSPGLAWSGRSRKVSSLQVSINEGTNEPFRPRPLQRGEGRWGRRTGLSSAVRAGGPPSLISSVLRRPGLPAHFHYSPREKGGDFSFP